MSPAAFTMEVVGDPKAIARDYDGQKDVLTEADALIAYLQMLGTLVDFKTYRAEAPEHRR